MAEHDAKPVNLADAAALERFLDEHDLALLEFYTAGCSMCQAMEPVLGNVARATGVPVGLCNPGDDVHLADRFAIRSVPTLVLVAEGEEVARLAEGFQPTADVVAFVREHAPDAVSEE
ncbi:thioredoxin family protein [Natronobiforma cellulositropha]|uniref:thioredoxin family protein n=1 Tax=Natronobiforma cellulositropha TaxID=1679076 RepID=UPI0021D58917|nr:thioredoxin family protein [Natronobiforma cellulositropha]